MGRVRPYSWVTENGAMQLTLAPTAKLESYSPPVGLYREFAALQEEPAAVLRFVNRYGLLDKDDEEGPYRFDEWVSEIRNVRQRVQVADAVQAGNFARIRDAISEIYNGSIFRNEKLRFNVNDCS